MDMTRYEVRAAELVNEGKEPSDIVRSLFSELGEISAGFLIGIFAKTYNVHGGDIGYLFAGWWPDAPGSISDREFNERMQREVQRSYGR
ncbi:MAG TPA: hypothetical protein VIF82_04790 [Burkholderiaceae bacterium]|jgi:hypothetical protein